MSDSLIQVYLHLVWSTKNRIPFISPVLEKRLYPILRSVTKEEGLRVIALGGIPDHVHMLVCMEKYKNMPNVIRKIKALSSKITNQTSSQYHYFAWQKGYSMFSVSQSDVRKIVKYIDDQEIHHQKYAVDKEIKILSEW